MRQRVHRASGDGGFTLIELLIVIVVLGILSGIAVLGVARFRSDAGTAACRAEVGVVSSAADARAAATGVYPTSIAELVTGGYLKSAPTTGAYAFDATTSTVSRTPACGATAAPTTAAPTTAAPTTAAPTTAAPTTAAPTTAAPTTAAPTTAAPTSAAPTEAPTTAANALTAADWKVVFGQAVLSGSTVDIPVNARVMSVRPGDTSDVVFSTTATFRSGQGGYGLWVRGSLATTATLTGYSVQYDVGYGNSYVLRQWYNGNECTQPLAVSKMDAKLAINGPHSMVVVTKGDSLLATLDGTKVLDVPSLSAVVAKSVCGYPQPTGTDIGFRTFGVASVLFADTTAS